LQLLAIRTVLLRVRASQDEKIYPFHLFRSLWVAVLVVVIMFAVPQVFLFD